MEYFTALWLRECYVNSIYEWQKNGLETIKLLDNVVLIAENDRLVWNTGTQELKKSNVSKEEWKRSGRLKEPIDKSNRLRNRAISRKNDVGPGQRTAARRVHHLYKVPENCRTKRIRHRWKAREDESTTPPYEPTLDVFHTSKPRQLIFPGLQKCSSSLRAGINTLLNNSIFLSINLRIIQFRWIL